MANFVLNRNQNLFWGLLRARYLNKALQMFPFVFLDSPRALQLCSKSSRKTSQGEAYSGENLERSSECDFFQWNFLVSYCRAFFPIYRFFLFEVKLINGYVVIWNQLAVQDYLDLNPLSAV